MKLNDIKYNFGHSFYSLVRSRTHFFVHHKMSQYETNVEMKIPIENRYEYKDYVK